MIMMSPALFLTFAIPFILATRTNAESHTIKFVNNCGFGEPALMYNGENILTGDAYSSNGSFSGIAYLQTGNCNLNGENCTLLEMTLINSVCAGCGSSTDISLIPPHVFNVATAFEYYDGCDGVGLTCGCPGCSNAFATPNDNWVQRACQTDNVNLLITFCPVSASSSPCSSGGTPSTTTAATLPTTTMSPSPTSAPASSSPTPTPSSSPTPATSPTNVLTSSGNPGITTPSSASSPSVPTISTPTTSTPTTSPTTTSSTPGALNVSTTPSGLGTPYPTNTAGGRCRPRPSSISPIPTPTSTPTTVATATATTVNSVSPQQCPATPPSMYHRRARNARIPRNH